MYRCGTSCPCGEESVMSGGAESKHPKLKDFLLIHAAAAVSFHMEQHSEAFPSCLCIDLLKA